MGKRANIRATAANTAAIAASNAEMAKQARRDQLAAQGLIDFNVTDGVVRAVERRLAAERGQPVAPIGDPAGSYGTAAGGAVMLVAGLILAFTGVAGAASSWLMLIGVFMIGGGISNAHKIERLQRDEAEFEDFEQARARRRHDIVQNSLPPRPAPPATEELLDGRDSPRQPNPSASQRRHQRGMRRPPRPITKG